MENDNMPEGFSGFSWGLAGFCLPVLLWPLALLISPNLLKNPSLTDMQANLMSVYLWVYPFVLAVAARILYKLHQRRPDFAKKALLSSVFAFYALSFYVISVGFSV